MSRSAYASAQSDQGLCSPQIESLDTKECTNGEQMPGWDFAHGQDDMTPQILHMLEGTFVLDVVHVIMFLAPSVWNVLYDL